MFSQQNKGYKSADICPVLISVQSIGISQFWHQSTSNMSTGTDHSWSCFSKIILFSLKQPMLCILTSFRVLFWPFSTFCVHSKRFSVIFHLKSRKMFCNSLELVDMQTLVNSLRGYLKFGFFGLICNFFFIESTLWVSVSHSNK